MLTIASILFTGDDFRISSRIADSTSQIVLRASHERISVRREAWALHRQVAVLVLCNERLPDLSTVQISKTGGCLLRAIVSRL